MKNAGIMKPFSVALVAVLCVALVACARPPRSASSTTPATPVVTTDESGVSNSGQTGQGALADLTAAINALEGRGYHIGVAAAAMGAEASFTAGDWIGGEAWSTIKVPLAVAAARANITPVISNGKDKFPKDYGKCSEALDLATAIDQAIVVSDNCAAWQLWEGLGGDGAKAAAAVEAVLREGGDQFTKVVAVGDGMRLTSGMTIWSLADQATFAAHLPGLNGSAPVLASMARNDSAAGNTDMGLTIFRNAYTKAGWGDAPPEGPVSRQMGIIPVGDGKCSAVAIGTDQAIEATETLTALARAVQANLKALPAGPCPAAG